MSDVFEFISEHSDSSTTAAGSLMDSSTENMAAADSSTPAFQFSKTWHLLGPFRTGTRGILIDVNVSLAV